MTNRQISVSGLGKIWFMYVKTFLVKTKFNFEGVDPSKVYAIK